LPGEFAGSDVVVVVGDSFKPVAFPFGVLPPLFVALFGALVACTGGAGSGATPGSGAELLPLPLAFPFALPLLPAALLVLTVVVGVGDAVSGAGVDAGGGVVFCVVDV
jgi:hypothetical protein